MNEKAERTEAKPPNDRKYQLLWQSYKYFSEIEKLTTTYQQRVTFVKKGLSNQDDVLLDEYLQSFEVLKKKAVKEMADYGKMVPVWDWVISIKGISTKLAAKLIAQIDDISKAPTVSALWRYCGYAVIDGNRESGSSTHYNRVLKSTCYLICTSFIKQQTPGYSDIYYAEKLRLRDLYPEKIIVDGKTKYNDGHIHAMAMRKTIKVFLQHLWVTWRELEGLPVSKPYSIDRLGHGDYIPPFH